MSSINNPYYPIRAKIEKIITETPTIKTFVVRPETPITFKTGQFVELTVPGAGEAPFTPSSSPSISETMEITIMAVGCATKRLHAMVEGDEVGVRGPYGTAYAVDELKGREVLIVGGGVGLAPLRSLLLTLFAEIEQYKKIILRYGARTPEDIVYKYHIDEWQKKEKVDYVLTVDKGNESWKGNVGLVTKLLDALRLDLKNSKAVVCGPPIMMKFTTLKLLEIGYTPADIYLSMEKNMSCGLGKCGHCRLGTYYVCEDGPVMRYDMIKDFRGVWE
ncbi:MAG: FAD/NAD(P)-binding protein [Candidatus Omnitrophica bacterium]|nr:FAD/NAD(P)-binding protein [Candidatus Omnitrophota bacterium]